MEIHSFLYDRSAQPIPANNINHTHFYLCKLFVIFMLVIICDKMKKIISEIKNFFVKLRRSCRWFKRMWNNHDFDDSYLMRVIVWKMKDMLYQLDIVDKKFVDLRNQEHYRDNGYNGDMIKSLEECIELGEKIIADEYICYPEIVEDWFSKHDFNEKMPEDIHKLLIASYEESDNKKMEDNEKFFDIMKKHHWGWWS